MDSKEFTLHIGELTSDISEKLIILSMMQEDIGQHDHQFFEFAYITGGSATHTLDGIEYQVKKGDYFFVDIGSKHGYSSGENLSLINCLFLPEILDDSLKGCISFEELIQSCLLKYHKLYFGKRSVNRIYHDRDDRVAKLITGMDVEYQKKEVGYEDVFRCRLLEILILTMREVVETGAIQSTIVKELIHYINRNYTESALLLKFCNEYHFTKPYISRRFKEEMGINITEYVQRIRIEKCCGYLVGSDLPITEIAQRVGYADMKFFHKLFRRIKNVSPREYRRRHSLI